MFIRRLTRVMSNIWKNGFSRRVLILVGATVLGQGLGILTMPIITRLYGPGEFGLFGLFSSCLGLLMPVASWRFQAAIPLPKSDDEALDILGLSILMTVLCCIAAAAGLFFFRKNLIQWLNSAAFGPYVFLVPIGLFGVGLYEVLSSWALRKRAFGLIGRTKITQGITQTLFQIGFGLFKIGPIGLIVGDIFGRMGGAGALGILVWNEHRENLRKITFKRVQQALIRYRGFGIYSAPAAILNGFTVQLPIMILSKLFHSEIVGLYLLVHRLVMAPVSLLLSSVGQVYFCEAARLGKSHDVQKELFWKILKKMTLLSSPILIFVFFDSTPLFVPIFGIRWAGAGAFLRILAPLYFITAVVSPMGATVDVMEKQGLHLLREIVRIGLLAGGAYWAAVSKLDSISTLKLLSAAGALGYCFYLLISYLAICHSETAVREEKIEVEILQFD